MNASSFKSATWLRSALLLTAAVVIPLSIGGCSLFVMAGKMFFGDPKVAASFQNSNWSRPDGRREIAAGRLPKPSLDSQLSSNV